MIPLKRLSLCFCLLLSALNPAQAGSSLAQPLESFVNSAQLVAVIEVTKVEMIEVKTGEHQVSRVYVAEANIIEALKSDISPAPPKRKIAIVSSTIPFSSAVWRPIEKRSYIAFLNHQQGHYTFQYFHAFRPVDENGTVSWLDKNQKGTWEIQHIKLKEAIKRTKNAIMLEGMKRNISIQK